VFRIAAQQLDGIGVAADEQGQQLVEGVHGGVRLRIHHLLKIAHTQQVGLAVQSTAPDINIRALHISAIGVAAPIGEKNNMFSKMEISLQKLVLRFIK